MADGPRWKRRKQANPRRNNVTNYSDAVDASSDSDDEDKLHIVEEESLPDGADGDSSTPEDEPSGPPGNQVWDGVKNGCDSDGEETGSTDVIAEEILQHGDTPIIYPQAPEDTPEVSSHDENGTADTFSQLLTCPYCARGYKRYTSLKEHIKYRHEKSEDNFSCTLCSYTFSYRTQLDRHMTVHKSSRDQRHVNQTGANRKFKCTECTKAFKYKHHLKEHLRIHSGEKPYECSNCKKRFSHSGSYSSHISSKKCMGLLPANGRPQPGSSSPPCGSPSHPPLPSSPGLCEKVENSTPVQEQLPSDQIKPEPVKFGYKQILLTPGVNGVVNGVTPLQASAVPPPQGLVQAVVLPTVGLVSPISINLSDIQNVLRQVRESALSKQQAGLAPAGVISTISLPIVDQDGITKIIINYSLDPSQIQPAQLVQKKEDLTTTEVCKVDKAAEDVLQEVDQNTKTESETQTEEESVAEPTAAPPDTCILCENCPERLDALEKLEGSTLEEGIDTTELASSLPGVGQTALKSLSSLLKAYFALNTEPTVEELTKISDSVSLPVDVVKKWFDKMRLGENPVAFIAKELPVCTGNGGEAESQADAELSEKVAAEEENRSPVCSTPVSSVQPVENPIESGGTAMSDQSSSSPLNLSSTRPEIVKSEEDSKGLTQVEPLDLSLPKVPREDSEGGSTGSASHGSGYTVQEEPLNLTCTKKEQSPTNCVCIAPQSANPINLVTTQLPTIVAIADQSSVPCLRALTTNKQTILIPQLTYTLTSPGTSPAGTEIQLKPTQVIENQEERLDSSSDGVSTQEDHNDSDSTPPQKKMRKLENGMYACDLCDKIFQKSSSLLRHKYEHTGKRPHECGICSKAFKHKHHLIEHTRLHSGEKPYQCDKCGKRFSHSGSYSQHMNHRYSYCKKEGPGGQLLNVRGAESPSGRQANGDSDERSSTREEDSEEEEEEEEEEMLLNDDEIQIVRVGEGEESEDDVEEKEEEETVLQGTVTVKEEEEMQEVDQSQVAQLLMVTEEIVETVKEEVDTPSIEESIRGSAAGENVPQVKEQNEDI